MDLSEIKELLERHAATWVDFRKKQFDPLKASVIELEKCQQRMLVLGGGNGVPQDTKELDSALRNLLRGDDRDLKGMSVGSEPGGGYMVLPAFSGVSTVIQISPVVVIENSPPWLKARGCSRAF